ncbi:sigma-70 family RNA polymerase sigma factor [Oribacterium sp. WCC10]|uniref:sigma-70 family RNA polymerase sigma factor n=1 Tax=Oribacterium sp. WCC10 TaxID=1855343 RepID=UPI0008EDFA76|nr:sigma-70 family RNA polymerase sigma factor [Oribacterium sp. WCC10]SFG49237.1 RNA polymerase primary sigma factor [Oribacterium sp. WCC10]
MDKSPANYETLEKENRALVELIQHSTGTSDAEAELCDKNKGLIIQIVRNYVNISNHTLSAEDLESVGKIGLIRAAKNYDPGFGVKFSTYAVYWIRDSIVKEIYNAGFGIRLSNHQLERIFKVQSILRKYDLEHLEGTDMIHAIMKDSGFSEEEVRRCLSLNNIVLGTTSLNKKISSDDDDSTELGDMEISPDNVEDTVLEQELHQELYRSLSVLSDDERDTLVLRYGLYDGQQHTLKEIATLNEVSIEAIRQREIRALKKLRRELD